MEVADLDKRYRIIVIEVRVKLSSAHHWTNHKPKKWRLYPVGTLFGTMSGQRPCCVTWIVPPSPDGLSTDDCCRRSAGTPKSPNLGTRSRRAAPAASPKTHSKGT